MGGAIRRAELHVLLAADVTPEGGRGGQGSCGSADHAGKWAGNGSLCSQLPVDTEGAGDAEKPVQ